MEIVKNTSKIIKRDFDSLVNQLNQIQHSNWDKQKQEVAQILVAFRNDNCALKKIVSDAIYKKSFPEMKGAQSFTLFSSTTMAVRVNLWFPASTKNLALDRLRQYLSIGELHNHDFNFASICLVGPGYRTHFYRESNYKSTHKSGDLPDLSDLGEYALMGDDVLFVEKDVDYHMQFWPDAFTITLNAIPLDPYAKQTVQYLLDPKTLRIKTVITNYRPAS
jgi:hypothetical protein